MSSKRHIRRKKCEKKIKFASRALAIIFGQKVVRRGGDWLQAYPCGFCKQWHLGHRPAYVERATAQGIARSRVVQKLNKAKA